MVKFDLLCSCQTKTDLGCYQTHPSVMLTGPDKTLEIAGRFPRSPTPSPPPPMPRTARRRRRAAPDTASNPPHRHMELMCRRKAQALPRAALQRAHRRAAVPCGADSCANGDDDGLVVCGGVSSMS